MEKKFSAAPWEVILHPAFQFHGIKCATGHDIVCYGDNYQGIKGGDLSVRTANANLIAAAPELLAYLEALIAGEQFISFYHMDMSDKEATQGAQYREVFERAKQIVKKAYGEQ